MPSLTHILETTALMLVAYLLGCILGYLVHIILHAARGTRRVTPAMPVAPVAAAVVSRQRPAMTPAAPVAAASGEKLAAQAAMRAHEAATRPSAASAEVPTATRRPRAQAGSSRRA